MGTFDISLPTNQKIAAFSPRPWDQSTPDCHRAGRWTATWAEQKWCGRAIGGRAGQFAEKPGTWRKDRISSWVGFAVLYGQTDGRCAISIYRKCPQAGAFSKAKRVRTPKGV